MASWLSGYSKRIKLTVDNTNVDDTLSDFPVLVKISNSSGISSTDVTSVFTELGSDANRKKIAVTISDGETQCYVEIERFDYSNSVAELWIKVPSISSGATTDLYLYYDSSKSDNTTYIGDTGDTPAQSVWDSNFKLVMHMAQDPNGDVADAIKDSTSNVNHGTPGGAMTSADLVDGKVGKAVDFDGGDDFIKTGGWFDLSNNDFSLSAIIKLNTLTTNGATVLGLSANSISLPYWMFMYRQDKGGMTFQTDTGGGSAVWPSGINAAVTTDPHSVDLLRDRTTGNLKIAVDGAVYTDETYDPTFDSAHINNHLQMAAWSSSGGNHFPGWLDEIRVSDITRSVAWVKATHYSNWDGLISFGAEEAPMVFTFTDPIPVHLSTVYGVTKQLQLTTTISGSEPSYTYDAAFYSGSDVQVGSTVSGVNSGTSAISTANLPTPSGINYNWYVTVTSSGNEDTSPTYTFSNRFLYGGYITENDNPVNRVVRLYYRDTGELIDSTTSSGVDGYYSLDAITNDEHFIIAFDDEAGEDYNSLILDRLLPNGE